MGASPIYRDDLTTIRGDHLDLRYLGLLALSGQANRVSTFGGKADTAVASQNVRYWPIDGYP